MTVIGVVRPFVEAEFRRAHNWNWWHDLNANVMATFKDRPAIVAESIRTTTGSELVRVTR